MAIGYALADSQTASQKVKELELEIDSVNSKSKENIQRWNDIKQQYIKKLFECEDYIKSLKAGKYPNPQTISLVESQKNKIESNIKAIDKLHLPNEDRELGSNLKYLIESIDS